MRSLFIMASIYVSMVLGDMYSPSVNEHFVISDSTPAFAGELARQTAFDGTD